VRAKTTAGSNQGVCRRSSINTCGSDLHIELPADSYTQVIRCERLAHWRLVEIMSNAAAMKGGMMLPATAIGGRRQCATGNRQEKAPKRVMSLPDLEHARTAVPNGLASASGQQGSEEGPSTANDHDLRSTYIYQRQLSRAQNARADTLSMGLTAGEDVPSRESS
jgi:hypothetical protein